MLIHVDTIRYARFGFSLTRYASRHLFDNVNKRLACERRDGLLAALWLAERNNARPHPVLKVKVRFHWLRCCSVDSCLLEDFLVNKSLSLRMALDPGKEKSLTATDFLYCVQREGLNLPLFSPSFSLFLYSPHSPSSLLGWSAKTIDSYVSCQWCLIPRWWDVIKR